MIRLELPWPPSTNKQHGQRGTRRYSTKAVRSYRETVAKICMMERIKPLAGELICVLQLHPRKRWSGDVDNLKKVLYDALEKTCRCFANDRQIKTELVDVHAAEATGRIFCILYPRGEVKRIEMTIGQEGCGVEFA